MISKRDPISDYLLNSNEWNAKRLTFVAREKLLSRPESSLNVLT